MLPYIKYVDSSREHRNFEYDMGLVVSCSSILSLQLLQPSVPQYTEIHSFD
jgi:hypothetical protein